jgi:DNA transformation protein and related proteins
VFVENSRAHRPRAPHVQSNGMTKTRQKSAVAPGRQRRGRMKSMRVSETFRDYVLEQLDGVEDLFSHAMFGGVGLYAGDVFFGLIAADRLYLKVDDTNRAQFERSGSQPFKPYPGRATTMGYYEVPVSVLEDGRTLVTWARQSIAIAERGKLKRAKP